MALVDISLTCEEKWDVCGGCGQYGICNVASLKCTCDIGWEGQHCDKHPLPTVESVAVGSALNEGSPPGRCSYKYTSKSPEGETIVKWYYGEDASKLSELTADEFPTKEIVAGRIIKCSIIPCDTYKYCGSPVDSPTVYVGGLFAFNKIPPLGWYHTYLESVQLNLLISQSLVGVSNYTNGARHCESVGYLILFIDSSEANNAIAMQMKNLNINSIFLRLKHLNSSPNNLQ